METEEKPKGVGEQILEEALVFLDDLVKSGVTNMWGATPYLYDEFGSDFMDRQQCREVLQYWKDTFSSRHPSE